MAEATVDDREGFAAWYAREYPRVAASVALATRSPDLAEDATAEAFARALANWPKVREMNVPAAWVYRVAVNQVRSVLRRTLLERRWAERHRSEPDVEVALPDPALWRAVRTLPDRQRTVIALRYVLDLPEAEIASALGISRGTVAATLSAARRRLAQLVGPALQENER
jgi:RNA polymerase sigma-70 factor (ECF subfamily)